MSFFIPPGPLIPPSANFSSVSASLAEINDSLDVGTLTTETLTISDQSEWLLGPFLGNANHGEMALFDNIAIVGNPTEDLATIYTFANNSWILNNVVLIPSDNIGFANFGAYVAVITSGTTSTAIIGGTTDNNSIGAAWVYQNTGSGWTEVVKIIPPSSGPYAYITSPNFGNVSIVVSGNTYTAVIGGPSDNGNVGAAWIYQSTTGGGSDWSVVTKIVPGDVIGDSEFGQCSLAVNGTTYTALISGHRDNSNIGAAWIYQSTTGGGSGWTEIVKIIPPSSGPYAYINLPQFGTSVSLVNEGSVYTALIGGNTDNNFIGAAWVYQSTTGGGSDWEVVTKLVPNNYITTGGSAVFIGNSVSLYFSGTAYIAAVSGFFDNSGQGAIWIFTSTQGGSGWTQTNKLVTNIDPFNQNQYWEFISTLW